MDNDIKRLCKLCGKPIPASRKAPAKFCSDECCNEHRREYQRKYIAKRYATEEDYRKKRIANVMKANKEYKLRQKGIRYEFLATEIAELIKKGASTTEVAAYLRNNFLIRKDGGSEQRFRTIRVSEESR